MAKVKFSGFGITDMRGKVNGHVASKNRAGAYIRTKVTPVNPNTSYQQNVRATLTNFSQAWRALTQPQRDAWNAAVPDFATTDIFGDLRNPTGKNLFTKLNTNLTNIGQPTTNIPPALDAVDAVFAGTVTISVGTPTYEVDFTGAGSNVHVLVWATPSVSAGKSFVKSEYRLIGSFSGSASSPFDFESAYLSKFGAPTIGEKVFIALQPINSLTGQAGTRSESSAIVAA